MVARITAIILAALVCMGATCQQRSDPVLPPEIPKPMLDYRLLQKCDSTIPDVPPSDNMLPYLENHQLTVRKLDACACKHIALRNQTCKLSANVCEMIPECGSIVYQPMSTPSVTTPAAPTKDD